MSIDIFAKLTFLALMAMMVLPVILVVRLGRVRFAYLATRGGEDKGKDIGRLKVSDADWPDHILQNQNAYKNQFELPVLFYALTILALLFGFADTAMTVICFAFVVIRYSHAFVHVTSNNVTHRLNLFTASLVILVAQLLYLSFKVLGA